MHQHEPEIVQSVVPESKPNNRAITFDENRRSVKIRFRQMGFHNKVNSYIRKVFADVLWSVAQNAQMGQFMHKVISDCFSSELNRYRRFESPNANPGLPGSNGVGVHLSRRAHIVRLLIQRNGRPLISERSKKVSHNLPCRPTQLVGLPFYPAPSNHLCNREPFPIDCILLKTR